MRWWRQLSDKRILPEHTGRRIIACRVARCMTNRCLQASVAGPHEGIHRSRMKASGGGNTGEPYMFCFAMKSNCLNSASCQESGQFGRRRSLRRVSEASKRLFCGGAVRRGFEGTDNEGHASIDIQVRKRWNMLNVMDDLQLINGQVERLLKSTLIDRYVPVWGEYDAERCGVACHNSTEGVGDRLTDLI